MDNNQVGLRDLGQNVSRVLARIKQGETLTVTEHGAPIATLSPYQEASSLAELIANGVASPPTGGLPEFLAAPLLEVVPGEATASEALRQMREDPR
jgi:prevent-host-death family protein